MIKLGNVREVKSYTSALTNVDYGQNIFFTHGLGQYPDVVQILGRNSGGDDYTRLNFVYWDGSGGVGPQVDVSGVSDVNNQIRVYFHGHTWGIPPQFYVKCYLIDAIKR